MSIPKNPAAATVEQQESAALAALGPQLTEVEFTWLVHPDAVEGRDYDLERLTWIWKVTTDQDKTIVDDNQSGVNSMALPI